MQKEERFDPSGVPPLMKHRKGGLWILLAVMIVALAGLLGNPHSSQARSENLLPTETVFLYRPSATPTPTFTPTIQPTPTRTPIPQEFLENHDDTNGVVGGTVLLVVIILAGTISGMRVRRSQH